MPGLHEREIINAILSVCGSPGAGISPVMAGAIEGPGDDCAVLQGLCGHKGTGRIAVTTDTMVEGVHFSMDYFTPWFLGRKLAAVNLSDMAAQGAFPRWAFLNLAIPTRYRQCLDDFILPFAEGLCSMLGAYGAMLSGGDTVSSPGELVLSLTLMGELTEGRWLSRSGASPGDIIYCSGPLGESAAGLAILSMQSCRLQLRHKVRRTVLDRLERRHLDPVPRIGLGRLLLSENLACAGMDMSDGLATDLAHMCRMSGTGAEIHEENIPVSRALRSVCRQCRSIGNPLDLALFGGEDFELLWAVPPERCSLMEARVTSVTGRPPFMMGTMTDGHGVWLSGRCGRREITFMGYEH